MRGWEDPLGVFVSQREASVPASILLQDLDHVSEVKGQERIALLCVVRVDNCSIGMKEGRERGGGEGKTTLKM